ncbi:MAG: YbaK/EbsC family protein [Patescibacteria group bacterium]
MPVKKTQTLRQAQGPKKMVKKTNLKSKKPKTKVPKVVISPKLLKILDEAKVDYEIIKHKVVFTAFDLAQTLGAKIKEITKTLVIKADKNYVLAILPADANLDIAKFKKLLKSKDLKIVGEDEMVKVFKIKPGAVHPFGSVLQKTIVYVDSKVAKLKEAFFQPGSYTESIKMKVKDFIELEKPVKGDFSKAKVFVKPKITKPVKRSALKNVKGTSVKKTVKKVIPKRKK